MKRKTAVPEPLIAPQRVEEKETLNVGIEKPISTELDLYCKFLNGSGKGYVVQEMIRRTIQSDRAFAEWKKHGAAEAAKPEPSKVAATTATK